VSDISLRPIQTDDQEFLYRVYASTRIQELAPVPWSEEQKSAFLRLQFAAQHRYYLENYHSSRFEVVLVDGEPAGRLYVARWPEELRIIDVALLPEFRGRGIGSALIGRLSAEAEAQGLPLRIHVERDNPARGLYERLGFRMVADRGVYLFLERPAPAPDRPAPPTRAEGG
jgi:ribosomal protein S18 acetylase RimI-like enzyme